MINAATNTIGNINIAGQVIGNAGTTTDIIASGVLTVDGAANNNNGSMTLNGNTVNLASVSNAGAFANMTVSSLTASSGVVHISGDVTNYDGTTTIWAKDVNIDGVEYAPDTAIFVPIFSKPIYLFNVSN